MYSLTDALKNERSRNGGFFRNALLKRAFLLAVQAVCC